MRNAYLVVGAGLTLVTVALAVAGLVWTPYGPTAVDLLHRSAGPSARHLLGTDQFGRDVLSRVMAGGWRSLTLGFGATAIALAIGLPLALAGAYWRGLLDDVLMRLLD